jgi:TfoX/Sxy family transcriptional regulator of competence genes
MAYDEGLAERIRSVLSDVTEKRMFGGLAFLVAGRMSVGIVKDELMVRIGPERYEELLAKPHARAMDFTGRPMKGFLFIAPEGFEADADLERWVEDAVSYALTVSEKPRRPSRAQRRPSPTRR